MWGWSGSITFRNPMVIRPLSMLGLSLLTGLPALSLSLFLSLFVSTHDIHNMEPMNDGRVRHRYQTAKPCRMGTKIRVFSPYFAYSQPSLLVQYEVQPAKSLDVSKMFAYYLYDTHVARFQLPPWSFLLRTVFQGELLVLLCASDH